jgi:hypothetical protein
LFWIPTIYYSPNQLKSEDFRGPDFFVVLGAEKKERKSWVVWQEDGKYPNVIVELLSDSTASVDRGLKKEIYQNTFRTPTTSGFILTLWNSKDFIWSMGNIKNCNRLHKDGYGVNNSAYI